MQYQLPTGPDAAKVVEDTGIFKVVTRRLTLGNVDQLRRAATPSLVFDDIEARAMGLLRDLRRDDGPGVIEAVERGERPLTWNMRGASPAQCDAANVVFWLWHVRKDIEARGAEAAAYHGLQLGLAFGRMMVRPAEPPALTGRKVRGGGRKGAELAHGTPDKLAVRNERIIVAWESLRAVHLKESRSRIDRAVGKQFGLSERQVRAVRLNHRKES